MEIRKLNYRAGWLIADYLNETPRAITPELLRSVLPDGADPATEEYVYAALLSGFLGLDPEASEEDRFLEENYLRPGLCRLDTALYKDDPFRLLHCIQFLPEPFEGPQRDLTVVYCSDSVHRLTFRDQ